MLTNLNNAICQTVRTHAVRTNCGRGVVRGLGQDATVPSPWQYLLPCTKRPDAGLFMKPSVGSMSPRAGRSAMYATGCVVSQSTAFLHTREASDHGTSRERLSLVHHQNVGADCQSTAHRDETGTLRSIGEKDGN
jgi:hypothetical protein